jgi:hypothetical protein
MILVSICACKHKHLLVPYYKYVHSEKGFLIFQSYGDNFFLPVKSWKSDTNCLENLKSRNLKTGFIYPIPEFTVPDISNKGDELECAGLSDKTVEFSSIIVPVRFKYVMKKFNPPFWTEDQFKRIDTCGFKIKEEINRAVKFQCRRLDHEKVSLEPIKSCSISK